MFTIFLVMLPKKRPPHCAGTATVLAQIMLSVGCTCQSLAATFFKCGGSGYPARPGRRNNPYAVAYGLFLKYSLYPVLDLLRGESLRILKQ